MANSTRAVVASLYMLLGIVGGWAVWWLTLPLTEPVIIDSLGPIGALLLWAVLGLCLWAGFRVSIMVQDAR